MRVVAVGLDPRESHPVLLLQEATGRQRVLPVCVGLPEATAIELERQHVVAPRPVTHQLIANVIRSAGRRLEHVRITALRDSIFHAELVLDQGTRVSARVSDAVTLALHLDVPIQAEEVVLEEAALASAEVIDADALMSRSDEADEIGTEAAETSAEELEEFRRFLDRASPEDFGTND
ncbi:bifunctional nuclease family protein [Pseudonocardia hispaniensis]|uniref:Bifunctional nuclease family protein n=1 Tax=Pseudonocardia hispaniensis TaxID=904933 RepID=A0ABW1J5K3_9PSEU